jgi:hypothetical protein
MLKLKFSVINTSSFHDNILHVTIGNYNNIWRDKANRTIDTETIYVRQGEAEIPFFNKITVREISIPFLL